MNVLPRLGLLVCMAAAVVPAQATFGLLEPEQLKIALEANLLSPPSQWQFFSSVLAEDNRSYAALKLQTETGGACMVLAHAIPDPRHPSHAGLLEAWRILYPFLGLPNATWRLDQVVPPATQGWAFENPPASQLVVWPHRLRDAVTALRTSNYDYGAFGMSGTGSESVFVMPVTVTTSNIADDRYYHSAWQVNRNAFETGSFTQRVFDVAVNNYHGSNINQRQLESLVDLFEKSYRWQIQLQVVQVHKQATSNDPRIKVSKPTLWRRRSLGGQGQTDQDWFNNVGPRLELPMLTAEPLLTDHVVSTGMPTKFTEVTLLSDSDQSDIYAHVPLVGGGWATAQRVSEIGTGFNALLPAYQSRALFVLPANATSGICYLSTDPSKSSIEWIPTRRPAIGNPFPTEQSLPPSYQHASFHLLVVPLQ